jgi:hypothetical protein
MTPEDIQELGIEVASKCGWRGSFIIDVMLEALTDANYHSLRSRLEDAINNYIEDEGAPL